MLFTDLKKLMFLLIITEAFVHTRGLWSWVFFFWLSRVRVDLNVPILSMNIYKTVDRGDSLCLHGSSAVVHFFWALVSLNQPCCSFINQSHCTVGTISLCTMPEEKHSLEQHYNAANNTTMLWWSALRIKRHRAKSNLATDTKFERKLKNTMLGKCVYFSVF